MFSAQLIKRVYTNQVGSNFTIQTPGAPRRQSTTSRQQAAKMGGRRCGGEDCLVRYSTRHIGNHRGLITTDSLLKRQKIKEKQTVLSLEWLTCQ